MCRKFLNELRSPNLCSLTSYWHISLLTLLLSLSFNKRPPNPKQTGGNRCSHPLVSLQIVLHSYCNQK